MRGHLLFSILIAASVLVGAQASAAPWEPDGGVIATLHTGQAWADVTGEADGVGLIHAAIEIAAPPAKVWRIMTDCRETPKLITSADPCRVVQMGPGGAWDVREQVTHGGLFVPTIHNVYRSDYTPFTVIRFHRVAGDLRVEEGEWRFEPLDGGRGTRVIYINRVAAPILLPGPVVRAGLKSDTPKVLMNLKHECMAR